MNCIDWEERVALHAGSDLAGPEADEVERHLRDCAGCQVFWSGLKETLDGLRETHMQDIPAAHFAVVRAGVMAEIERGQRVWRRLAWVSGVGIAAMLLIGLALRPLPLPAPPPRVASRVPEAPVTARVRPRSARRAAKSPLKKREPILVKLQTSDPNIVIYWIAD